MDVSQVQHLLFGKGGIFQPQFCIVQEELLAGIVEGSPLKPLIYFLLLEELVGHRHAAVVGHVLLQRLFAVGRLSGVGLHTVVERNHLLLLGLELRLGCW